MDRHVSIMPTMAAALGAHQRPEVGMCGECCLRLVDPLGPGRALDHPRLASAELIQLVLLRKRALRQAKQLVEEDSEEDSGALATRYVHL